jgi:hypothetical protein
MPLLMMSDMLTDANDANGQVLVKTTLQFDI